MCDDHPFIARCPECGKFMIPTSQHYISCPDMCGKLFPRCKKFNLRMKQHKAEIRRLKIIEWKESLPSASWTGERLGQKMLFTITGKSGKFIFDGKGMAATFEKGIVAYRMGKVRKFVKVDQCED